MAWVPVTEGMNRVLETMGREVTKRQLGEIHDVRVKSLVKHADARGFFIEQLKRGDHDDQGRPFVDTHPFAQMSRSIVYARGGNPPEPIKAFHWHRYQWDYWDVVAGNARVVLVDLREESPTAGAVQVLTAGDDSPRIVAIPPLVAHGYQCLGTRDVHLVYYVTEPYDADNPDEGRIRFDDPRIGFDWRVENI